MADLYKRLGIEHGATTDEIKRAYRSLAKEKHPDRGGNPEEFKSIQEAHEILTDEKRRKMYDMTGSTDTHNMDGMAAGGIPFSFMGGMGPFGMPGVSFDMGDMFAGLFGAGGRQQRRGGKGPNKFHDIGLKLTNFYNGGDIKLKFNQARRCNYCAGSGAEQSESCGMCGGSGIRTMMRQIGPGMIAQSRGSCDICNGEGKRILKTCRGCGGKKFVEKEKSLDIKIIAGMTDGETLTFNGECSDSIEYDIPGDVVLTLRRSDAGIGDLDEFIWKGDDLLIRKEITYAQSILGFSIVLDTHPNGKNPCIVWEDGPLIHGATIVVAGLGMPKKMGGYGNLILQTMIQPPAVRKWNTNEKMNLESVFGGVQLDKRETHCTATLHNACSLLEVSK
jgi:DnaJ-class molecular chaperone